MEDNKKFEEIEEQEDISEENLHDALSEEEQKKILAEYDQDSNMRLYAGVPRLIMRWLCVAFAAFMLIINIPGFLPWITGLLPLIPTIQPLPPQVHRSVFVGLVILLVFLLYPTNKKKNTRVNYIPWFDLVLAITGAACFFYYALNFETIVRQAATFTTLDLIVAVIGIAILFIACYRVMGLPLVIVVGIFLAYTWFGQFIPGLFGHAGFRFERVFVFMFYTTEGVIGIPIGVASTFIFVFMLFGAFMGKTGIGQFFIDISNAITGKATGGPAKMVVIVSALMGMLSGSSVANTVASGSYTIPMMKRMGYEKNFAGAVEASASTGGQIVPPILGAAAFLMAEITGIPYTQIALAALIPAVLYFITIFAAVHFEAKKKNLRGLPPEEIPKALPLLLKRGQLCLGIVAIVVFLAMGFTPTLSALLAIVVSIAVSMFRKDTRLNHTRIIDAFETGARNVVGVAVACGMAGIITGVVSLTGLGHAFIQVMLSLANVISNDTLRLIVVLIFCGLASIILGLGIPTTAKYVIMATVTAPVLASMIIPGITCSNGAVLLVPVLAAHMFVFYFGVDADITPPVGLAAYAAAGISKGDPMITGVYAMRLGIANYLVPFFFVFNPMMLFISAACTYCDACYAPGVTVIGIIHLVITSTIGVIAVAAGLAGYFFRPMGILERVLTVIAGVILAGGAWYTDLFAIVLLIAIFLNQKFRGAKQTATP